MTKAQVAERNRCKKILGGKDKPPTISRYWLTNPGEPAGTATERVHQYWRTPRFKKDRAWLEEHLGQQKLFQYNPATLRVGKVGAKGYGLFIGQQLIGAPTTKEIADRRARHIRSTAAKFGKKNPASPKKAVRSSGKKNPQASAPSQLHVIHITPGKYGVFLRTYLLKTFKTKAAADAHMRSIQAKRKNPFDSEGLVIDERSGRTGEVIAATREDGKEKVVVKWHDGKTSIECKCHLYKENGFKSWRLRRKAARQYKKELKHGQKASRAKGKRRDIESMLRNPSSGNQKHLHEFKLAVEKLASPKATVADLRKAMNAGKAAGFTQDEIWRLVKRTWNGSVKKNPKRNPGMLSTLAEIAVGMSAAMDVHSRLSEKPAKRKAKKRVVRTVPNTSQKKKTPKKNRASQSYQAFQGRPSTKDFEIETAPGTPKNLWCLGRLLEVRVAGFGTLKLSGKRFFLCATEINKRQMYIAGPRIFAPDTSIPAGKRRDVGEVIHVVYETEKAHLGDGPGETSPYIHKMGEEGGERPVFTTDREGYGHFEGGDYEITPLGIKN